MLRFYSCRILRIGAQQPCRRLATGDAAQRTALYDLHVSLDAKLVPFGGFWLPLQFADQSIAASHRYTRHHASLFDVSHMLQTRLRGRDAVQCLQSVCTADLASAAVGSSILTVFTSGSGGILDDLIVTLVGPEELHIVSNAAMRDQDAAIMEEATRRYRALGKDVVVEFLPPSERSLLAVQGPAAVTALARLAPPSLDLGRLYFMSSVASELAGVADCRVTRCGYTGEDGVEISLPSARARHMAEALMDADAGVRMAGLGARDTLRLEAGLCLYGSDMDATTTPVEANLAWLVARRRRMSLDFPGARTIVEQLKGGAGVKRRRVGVRMVDAKVPPARAGCLIYHDGEQVGHITSGCPSPCLGYNIAMGYIREELRASAVRVQLLIRERFYEAELTKMPFVPSRYHMKPKAPK